ncbi:hypothetical protein HZB94_00050 [Candidatus Falkowbacteria bacterium]|nr:hypothetical protein [Candidatus Falkowbacteria bacterium]
MKNNLAQKEVILSALFLVCAIIVIVLAFSANQIYFKPQEKNIGGQTVISFEKPADVDFGKELAEINKDLLENEKFDELEKHGDWPLALEKIKAEKKNPFDKVQK